MLNSTIDFKSLLSDPTHLAFVQMLVTSFNDPYFILDLDFRYLAFNAQHKQNFKELYGDEIEMGMRFIDYLPTIENRQFILQKLNSVLQGEHIKAKFYAGSDQFSRRWMEIQFDPITDDDHSVIAISVHAVDVTELLQQENKLKISEVTHRSIIETAIDGWWLVAANGKILEVNRSYEQIIGYSAEELLEMNVSDIEFKEDADDVQKHIQHIITFGFDRFESQHRRKDGRIIDIEVSLQFESQHGFIFAFFRDITQKKQTEKQLLDSQLLYASFVENIPAGVFRKDYSGKYIFVNSKFCQNKGLTKEEILGKTAIELAHYLSDKDALDESKYHQSLFVSDEQHQTIMKTGAPMIVEEAYPQLDGSVVYLHVTKTPVYSSTGEIIGTQGIQLDITNLKLVEQELVESNRYNEMLISNLPGFVYRCAYDHNWTMDYLSEGCKAITGYAPDDFINNKKLAFNDIIHPDYQEAIFKKWEDKLHDKRVFKEEYPIITANSEIKWVWEQGRGEYDENGNLVHLEGFITDITDKKNAEKAFAESERKFRNFFENSVVGKSITKIDGSVYPNQAFCDILGYTIDEFKNVKWAEFTPSEQLKTDKQKIEELLAGESKGLGWEKCYIHKNGSYVWVELSTILQRDNDGKPIEFFTEIVDVTERKKIENTLRNSEQKFRDIFEFSVIGLSVTTLDGYFNANQAFADIIGYSIDELSSLNWRDISHPDDVAYNELVVQSILKGEKKTERWVKRYIHKDGHLIWAEISTTLLRDNEGTPMFFITTLNDITKQKENAERLRESEERFRSIFEKNFSVMLLIDPISGKIVDANPSACEFYGWPYEEFTHKTMWDINTMPELEIRENMEMARMQKQKHFSFIHRKSDGSLCNVDVYSTFIEQGGKTLLHSIVHDVTEQKKAERALKESERRFREMLANLKLVSVVIDIDGNIVFCNEFLASITGWKKDEIIGHNWFELFIDKEIKGTVKQMFIQALKNDNYETYFENEIKTKTGEDILIAWNNTVLYDEKGQANGIASIGTDITEQRKSADLIKESLDRLDRAEKVSKSGNWELDLRTQKIKASNGAGLIYGIKGEDLDYEIIKKVPLHEYRSMMDEAIINLITIGFDGHSYDIEFKIKTVDTGEIKDIRSTAYFDVQGQKVFGVIQDITEKKRAEKELLESEQKLSTLFANMSEMVVIHELIFDDNGVAADYKIIECNDAFTKITGLRREDCIGQAATDVYQTPEAPYLDIYTNVALTGETVIFQTYFEPFDKHFLVSAVSLGNHRFSTISNDITEIQKSKDEVMRTNQELENYMYVASHDLRTPLVNIQGFSQRLIKQNQEMNKIVEECKINSERRDRLLLLSEKKMPDSLQYIQTNVAKMDKLISSLLQISRTGRLMMDVKNVNMNKLIESILNANNYLLTEIDSVVKLENLHDCTGDENQLNQLFSNLIGNAIKFRHHDRRLQIEINSKTTYSKVTYSFKDNGVGIHPRHLERIWDVFYRVDASDSNAGDGIGLSLAKRIVDKHRGRIWVESTEGEGSTFFVELPVLNNAALS